jgi:hypothetical protein
LQGLPAEARSVMGESMAAAQRVIAELPAVRVPSVHAAVESAFLDGLWLGSMVSAAIALTAAVVVAVLLPAREHRVDVDAAEAGEPATRTRQPS